MDSPTPQPLNPSTVSKVHMWMLGLLVWTSTFSLIAVGLLLVRSSDTGLSDTEVSAACQNGVLNGITTNLTRISDACNASSASSQSEATEIAVSGTEEYPGFTTPANWSIYGSFDASAIYTILMDRNPMVLHVFGVDGPGPGSLRISTQSIPADAKSDASAYVAAQFSDTHFSNNTTSVKTMSNGTLYTTTVDELVDIDGGHHRTVLFFFTPTRMITVRYDAGSQDGAVDTIASTLDWSTVK